MTALYALDPVVPGDISSDTKIVNIDALRNGDDHVPVYDNVTFVLNIHPSEDLVQTNALYLVSRKLSTDVLAAGFSGFAFEEVNLKMDENLVALFPDLESPDFVRMLVGGEVEINVKGHVLYWSLDDFCIGRRVDFDSETTSSMSGLGPIGGPYCLVVTERAYDLLLEYDIEGCEVRQLTI